MSAGHERFAPDAESAVVTGDKDMHASVSNYAMDDDAPEMGSPIHAYRYHSRADTICSLKAICSELMPVCW